MIYQAFQSWEESPITTTIDTFPITEITFPEVTVCPPKNTKTDLNKLLILNESLSNETRQDILEFALEMISDYYYEEVYYNMSFFDEKDRFSNWYKHLTEVTLPYSQTVNGDQFWRYYIRTYDTNGFFSTREFGQNFNKDKVDRDIIATIEFRIPRTKR